MMRRLIPMLALLASACENTGGSGGAAPQDVTPTGYYVGATQSRDGRLAYSRLVDGKSAVFVSSGDAREPQRVSFGVWDVTPVWSADGKWIAIFRDANNGDAVLIPTEGAVDSALERIVAATPLTEAPIAFLPDGSGLLYRVATAVGNAETWLHDLATGKNERFLKVEGSAVGFPSPDGTLIGYVRTERGASTVWIWERASDTHRQLTTEGFEASGARSFSPDGKALLFASRRTGTADLWRIDIATGERTQLTKDIANDVNGRWSPDGTRILFQSDRGGQPDLWVMRTGEDDVQRVTDDALGESWVSWASDGSGVVVQKQPGFSHLYSLPVDGGAPVALTAGDWSVNATSVALSSDGTSIVYAGARNGDDDLWIVPVGGGESRLLTSAPGVDVDPQWSPDGTRIVFRSSRAGSDDIWVVSAAGGEPTRLMDWPTNEVGPRWSPDGATIGFLSNRESRGTDLWSVPASGGTPKRLTTLGTIFGDWQWARDGRSLLFTAIDATSNGPGVFAMPSTGGTARRLVSSNVAGIFLSRGGREFTIQRTKDGYGTIEVYDLTGKLLRVLSTEEKVYEGATDWSSDDSQLVVQFQNIYGDGSGAVAIQPAAGGARRPLNAERMSTFSRAFFADSDRKVVATLEPLGQKLLRIPMP